MASFDQVWENMHTSPTKPNSKAEQAIRTGLNVDEDFWDQFLLVINNADALSDLLDVPASKIGGWHSKIQESLQKVKDADSNEEAQKNHKLISPEAEPDPKTAVLNPLPGIGG